MTAALDEALLDATHKPALVADALTVLDAEVAAKKGVAGLAVKGGYAALHKVSPSLVPDALESLLPEFLERLQPFWQDYRAGGDASFGQTLATRGDEVSDALLQVTDTRVAQGVRPTVQKVYASLRPVARKHVVEALPRVGNLVERCFEATPWIPGT